MTIDHTPKASPGRDIAGTILISLVAVGTGAKPLTVTEHEFGDETLIAHIASPCTGVPGILTEVENGVFHVTGSGQCRRRARSTMVGYLGGIRRQPGSARARDAGIVRAVGCADAIGGPGGARRPGRGHRPHHHDSCRHHAVSDCGQSGDQQGLPGQLRQCQRHGDRRGDQRQHHGGRRDQSVRGGGQPCDQQGLRGQLRQCQRHGDRRGHQRQHAGGRRQQLRRRWRSTR